MKVLDFGLVRLLPGHARSSLALPSVPTQTGAVVGSPRYPFLDLEDLERVARGAREELEISKSRVGGVALCARGAAVAALGVWLSNAFASGVRTPRLAALEQPAPRRVLEVRRAHGEVVFAACATGS